MSRPLLENYWMPGQPDDDLDDTHGAWTTYAMDGHDAGECAVLHRPRPGGWCAGEAAAIRANLGDWWIRL